MKNGQIIRVINTLIGKEVEYEIRSDSLIFMNIHDELLEIHSDTGKGEYFAEVPYALKNLMEIFNYVLIRTVQLNGWSPGLLALFGSYHDLHRIERYHLNRIAKNREVFVTEIFQLINTIPGSPDDAQDIINRKFPVTQPWYGIVEMEKFHYISPKLVKAIRAKMRKMIITKIVDEVLNSKE